MFPSSLFLTFLWISDFIWCILKMIVVHVHSLSLETFPMSCAMRITSHLPKNAFHPRCIVWIMDSLSYFSLLQLPYYKPPPPLPVDIHSCTYTRIKHSHTHPGRPKNILRIKRFIVTQTVTEAHIRMKSNPSVLVVSIWWWGGTQNFISHIACEHIRRVITIFVFLSFAINKFAGKSINA